MTNDRRPQVTLTSVTSGSKARRGDWLPRRPPLPRRETTAMNTDTPAIRPNAATGLAEALARSARANEHEALRRLAAEVERLDRQRRRDTSYVPASYRFG